MKSALRPMLGHRYQDACNCDSRNILGTCTRRDAVSMYYRAASWLTFRAPDPRLHKCLCSCCDPVKRRQRRLSYRNNRQNRLPVAQQAR